MYKMILAESLNALFNDGDIVSLDIKKEDLDKSLDVLKRVIEITDKEFTVTLCFKKEV